MQLTALHLDDALKSQPDFLAALNARGAQSLEVMEDGAQIRLWGKFEKIDRLKQKIEEFARDSNQPRLWWMGSGDFHHISALLQEITLSQQTEPVTVIHFDNHPDWVRHDHNLHCGSWVNRAAANDQIAKIITIGVTSEDLTKPESQGANLSLLTAGKLELFPYNHAPSAVRSIIGDGPGHAQRDGKLHWRNIAERLEDEFITTLLSRIETRNIYLTIDKDVLARTDAITNWDQGGMSLAQLLAIITALGKAHHIIGADVNGDYSKPHYTGDLVTRLMKHGEILLDQPWRTPTAATIMEVNQRGNFALLDALSEVMA